MHALRWRKRSRRPWAMKPSRTFQTSRASDEMENAGSLRRRNITYFPVVPGRVEFAVEIRQWLLAKRPEVLAVELPLPMRGAYLRAIARFPEISILRFPDPLDPLQWVYVP